MKALIRKSWLVVTLLLVATYSVVALRGPNGLGALTEKRRLIRDLQEQNATLDAENKRTSAKGPAKGTKSAGKSHVRQASSRG